MFPICHRSITGLVWVGATYSVFYYAPNFEKVDGAYRFWSVRGCVGEWVTLFVPTVTFNPLKLES